MQDVVDHAGTLNVLFVQHGSDVAQLAEDVEHSFAVVRGVQLVQGGIHDADDVGVVAVGADGHSGLEHDLPMGRKRGVPSAWDGGATTSAWWVVGLTSA